jgi:site-specific recombinase XerD
MTALRQRMLEDMQIRNLASATQRAYVEHVARFARHFGRSPALLGPEEIRTYLVYLTTEKRLAPSTIIIAVAALRFLYTVTLPKPWSVQAVLPAPKIVKPLPVVLSPAESCTSATVCRIVSIAPSSPSAMPPASAFPKPST